MREFRLECITLATEPINTAWDVVANNAQALLQHYAPEVDFSSPPNGWEHEKDEWHHWYTVFDESSWVACGTFIYAALVVLMLRNDPDLLGFAAVLYYRDDGGGWVECG